MSARALSVLLTSVALLLALPANAVTVAHAPSGFHVDLATAGIPVCLVSPEALREPETCDGIDLSQLNPPANTIAFGIGRLEHSGMSVTVMAFPSAEPLTLASARGFTEGFLSGFTSSQPGARLRTFPSGTNYETSVIRGTRVLHYVVLSAMGATQNSMVTHSWTWDAEGHYVTLSLAGAAEDEPSVLSAGGALVAAAAVTPRAGSAIWERGGMTPFQMGRLTGTVLGALAIIAMLARRFARGNH